MGYFDSDASVGRAIVARGYELPVIFDVGGSNGSWSSIMQDVFPHSRFELFEPLAEINAEYKRILASLPVRLPRARLHPVAIGAEDGTTTIKIFDDPSGSTTLAGKIGGARDAVEVPVRSIDSIVSSQLCASPDLIKIDIQGGELAALKGAVNTLPQVSFLMLETWLKRSYGPGTPLLVELMAFLGPYGFVPYEFGETFKGADGETASIDVWFINVRKSKRAGAY